MSLFTEKAPRIMRDLMRDFPISKEDAAAIVGNLGHESGGFAKLQEIAPTVKGSRGGYGWAQWTGPRRRAFEAWCKKEGLSPASDAANYGYLVVELRGDEKAAVPAVKKAVGLRAKVIAFEAAFERAGVKHYDSRVKYAQQALTAYAIFDSKLADPPKPSPIPPPPDIEPPPPREPVPTQNKDLAIGAGAVVVAATAATFWDRIWAFISNLF